MGAVVGFTALFIWILVFQLNWKSWGRAAVNIMISTPSSYSTGW